MVARRNRYVVAPDAAGKPTPSGNLTCNRKRHVGLLTDLATAAGLVSDVPGAAERSQCSRVLVQETVYQSVGGLRRARAALARVAG